MNDEMDDTGCLSVQSVHLRKLYVVSMKPETSDVFAHHMSSSLSIFSSGIFGIPGRQYLPHKLCPYLIPVWTLVLYGV